MVATRKVLGYGRGALPALGCDLRETLHFLPFLIRQYQEACQEYALSCELWTSEYPLSIKFFNTSLTCFYAVTVRIIIDGIAISIKTHNFGCCEC